MRTQHVKIQMRGDDVFHLCAPGFAEMLMSFADACEEVRRRDIMIFDDFSARRGFEDLDAAVPADRVVIDQNV